MGPPTPGQVEFLFSSLADFNGDDLVNDLDIDLLAAAVHSNTDVIDFDIDHDQAVGKSNLNWLVHEILRSRFGDSNLDGDVTTIELERAFMNFTGTSGSNRRWASGDTDGDGGVDTMDLTTTIKSFTGDPAS